MPQSPDADAIVLLALADLDPSDEAYRFRLALSGVEGLAEDIHAHGQDFPIVVRPATAGPAPYQLICGFRRVAALRHLGATHARAVVRSLDDDAALRLAWSENEARRSYSDLDRAHAVFKARREGWTLLQLETLFSLKKSQLQRLSLLATCPAPIQEALAAGHLRSTHALVLIDLQRRYPDMDLDHWLQVTLDESLSVRDLRRRVHATYDPPRRPLVRLEGDTLAFTSRTIAVASLAADERADLIAELEAALNALRSS